MEKQTEKITFLGEVTNNKTYKKIPTFTGHIKTNGRSFNIKDHF